MRFPLVAAIVLVRLLGVGFLAQGVGWLVVPQATAASLGMTPLDGLGRSTQFGDFAAFFLTAGVTMIAGARTGHARSLWVPAFLFATAAAGRTVAWAFHGADFAGLFIAIELAMALFLLNVARSEPESNRVASR